MNTRPRRRALSLLAVLAAFGCVLAARTGRAEAGDAKKVAVVDAEAMGVADDAAKAVTRQLYATVARLGYLAVPETATRSAASRPHMSPRTPADLLEVARATHADHAVSATLGALGERYAISVTLANADRSPPASKSAVTDAESLEASIDVMTRSLLPELTATESGGAPHGDVDAETVKPVHRLSLNTEGAVGLTSDVNESTPAKRPTFYNQIIGPRFDYGFPNDFALGAFIGYANLKGKDGRASNVLPYLELTYRTRVSKTSDFRIPIRYAMGYLVKNGPFMRISGGLDIPLGGGVHLGLDLVAPTLWVIANRTVLSLDWGAEMGFDL